MRSEDEQTDLKWAVEWLVKREGQRRTTVLLGVKRKAVVLTLPRERLTGGVTLAVFGTLGSALDRAYRSDDDLW